MLVRATQKGYYGVVLREPGQVFRLKPVEGIAVVEETNAIGKVIKISKVKKTFSVEEQFSHNWMEKVVGKQQPSVQEAGKKGKRGARPAPEDPSELEARIRKADLMAENAQREADEADADAAELEAAQADEGDEVI